MKFENDYIVFCAEMAYNETMMEHIAMAPIGIDLLNEGVGDILSSVKNWIKGLFAKFMNFLKTVKEKFMNLFKKKKKSGEKKTSSTSNDDNGDDDIRTNEFGESFVYSYSHVFEKISRLDLYESFDFYKKASTSYEIVADLKSVITAYVDAVSDGKLDRHSYDVGHASFVTDLKFFDDKISMTEKDILTGIGIIVLPGINDQQKDLGLLNSTKKVYVNLDLAVRENNRMRDKVKKKFDEVLNQFNEFPKLLDETIKNAKKDQDDLLKMIDMLSKVTLSLPEKELDSKIRNMLLSDKQKEFNKTLSSLKECLSRYTADITNFTSTFSKATAKAVTAIKTYREELRL